MRNQFRYMVDDSSYTVTLPLGVSDFDMSSRFSSSSSSSSEESFGDDELGYIDEDTRYTVMCPHLKFL